MKRIAIFVRQNRGPVAVAAVLIGAGAILFPVAMGLNSIVAVGLGFLVVAATLGVYRLAQGGPTSLAAPLKGSKLLASAAGGAIVVAVMIQAIPFGWDRSNPPVTAEPSWDSPQTRELAVRACFDCHSNEVDYPWYSRIAPMSWAVQIHVSEGREAVNYSEWDRPQEEADESAEVVLEGEMAPGYYEIAHPEARLSDQEIQALARGFEATIGSGGEGESGHDENDD
jgi:hypothetical protein